MSVNINSLELFCKDPTTENFRKLSEKIRKVLYEYSKAVDERGFKKYNVVLSDKIRTTYIYDTFLSEEAKKDVKTIFALTRLLQTEIIARIPKYTRGTIKLRTGGVDFLKEAKYPYATINFTDPKKKFFISYQTTFDKMFTIVDNIDISYPKQVSLYEPAMKLYIVDDLYLYNNTQDSSSEPLKIESIQIEFSRDNYEWFYKGDKIVWGQNEKPTENNKKKKMTDFFTEKKSFRLLSKNIDVETVKEFDRDLYKKLTLALEQEKDQKKRGIDDKHDEKSRSDCRYSVGP